MYLGRRYPSSHPGFFTGALGGAFFQKSLRQGWLAAILAKSFPNESKLFFPGILGPGFIHGDDA